MDELQYRKNALNENLKLYEKSIELLRKRQELLDQPSTSAGCSGRKREKSETPPPAPTFRTNNIKGGLGYHTIEFGKFSTKETPSSSLSQKTSLNAKQTQKFSFQIKKPVTVDKIGFLRLLTPVLDRSRSPSPKSPRLKRLSPRSRSRSRSRSRRRSRSRSCGRRSWNSRSRSRSRGRRYKRRSTSRSSSRDSFPKRRRDSRSLSRERRRRSPSYRDYVRPRTRSPYYRGRQWGRGRVDLSRGGGSAHYGNRVWKNPNPSLSPKSTEPSSSDARWTHDKYESNPEDDNPTVEEIDEIISKAQKERKQNIIDNDKDILKKSNNW